MADLNSIKKEISDMAELTLAMWQDTFQSFMDHDLDLLAHVLEKENTLNNFEKEITKNLIEVASTSAQKPVKDNALVYADIAGDLELIGDYCKDILERVEIKIEEKLLFSDDAVKEYIELYNKTLEAVQEVTLALKHNDPGLLKSVLGRGDHIDKLVDDYRHRHNQRMVNKVCSPMGCNMFLNMLDFTAAVYYHAKKIARNILKLK